MGIGDRVELYYTPDGKPHRGTIVAVQHNDFVKVDLDEQMVFYRNGHVIHKGVLFGPYEIRVLSLLELMAEEDNGEG